MASTDKLSRRYESRDNFHGSDGGKYGKESKYDDPPHSRLFIVCGKSITEEDFRESFSKHGTIEEIWVVKDRNTDEPKGKSLDLNRGLLRRYVGLVRYSNNVGRS